ncbi:MAG TPA: serine hydrolase [Puia sp.]|nr:serine hydrolase [Puia sp.]
MKKVLLILFAALILIKNYAQTPAQEINELLKQYSKQRSFNGVVLVAQKGRVLLEQGYGYKNATAKLFNDSATIFQIGSITKQFTAAMILQLEEKHKLSLLDRLSKYIPDFPNGDSITIENLLTHTSGIYNYTNDNAFMESNSPNPIKLTDLILLFKNKTLDFSPGTKYSYSNSGYILLGFIIEKITGKQYFTVIKENIIKPLGMIHTGFDFKNLKTRDKAIGYLKLTSKNILPAPIVDSSVSYAAGSMYTTVGDLYKWDRALYTNKILSDSSLRKTFTPFKNNYGYGWVIDSSYGKKVVMHQGDISGFVSFIARVPADETCIILFENEQSSGLPKIGENINSILNQQPYDFPRVRNEIEVDTTILKEYTGQYQLAPNFILTLTLEDGQLMVQATGQDKNELFAEKENLFFLKFEDMQIEFIRAPDGKVDRLTLYQYSQKANALKIK